MEKGTISELPLKAATISDLKSLCLALLDNLNDKSLALTHQRKTNKLLATKIADLEQRMAILSGNNDSTLSPSQILLNGYSSSTVDHDLEVLNGKTNGIENSHSELLSSEESNRSVISSSEFDADSRVNSGSDFETVRNRDEKLDVLEELPPEIAKLVLQMTLEDDEQNPNAEE